MTVISLDYGPEYVARTGLGKYANTLGPVTLTKGRYRLVVHPDEDSDKLPAGSELIRFGLDMMLEASEIGGPPDIDIVIEEVELCSVPALPDSFNGPGFIHTLSGNQVQLTSGFKLTELLEGAAVKFELPVPSLVTFYLQVPEGLRAEAEFVRVRGTHTVRASTEDLNK